MLARPGTTLPIRNVRVPELLPTKPTLNPLEHVGQLRTKALPVSVLTSDSASYDTHVPGVGLGHTEAVGLGVADGVVVGVGVWQKSSWLKASSESRMSAFRRRCAFMGGSICFFMVVVIPGISDNNP